MVDLSETSPALVAEALLKRRRIRRSLTEWCRHCGYQPAAHHRLLIDRLERVARGEIKRLAVFMPPGSAKSTYGSILFPPHVMAGAPGRSLLAASHTTELAEKWGRRVRNLIAQHSATLVTTFSTISATLSTISAVFKTLATLLSLAAFSDPALVNPEAVAALVEARAAPAIEVEAYRYLFDWIDPFERHGDIG